MCVRVLFFVQVGQLRYDRSNKVRFIFRFLFHFRDKINDKLLMDRNVSGFEKCLWNSRQKRNTQSACHSLFVFRFYCSLWVVNSTIFIRADAFVMVYRITVNYCIYCILFDSFLMVNWSVRACVCARCLMYFVVICSAAFSRLHETNESLSIYCDHHFCIFKNHQFLSIWWSKWLKQFEKTMCGMQ